MAAVAALGVASACGSGGAAGGGTATKAALPSTEAGSKTTGNPAGGGAPAKTATPDAGSKDGGGPQRSGPGSLIIARGEGLVEYDVERKTSKPLITPEQDNTYLLDPAVSPDGTLLAYVSQPPPKIEGAKYDAGSDLWAANRDGSNPHAVFTHDVPNQLVRFPQWEDAGHILAVVQEISRKDGRTNVVYMLERIDVATGRRTNVLEDVLSFGLSPDGKRAVYTKLAPQTGETLEVLELAANGGAAGVSKTLVGIDQYLSPFNSPRYSPDGSKVAFASADQLDARAPIEYVSARGFGPAPRAALDGLPEDIWVIDAAGGTPQRAADLKEDLPALAWNGDGTHIYVLGAAGLYDVNLANGATTKIGEGVFHGQLTWAP